jgi:hypothetical protein
VQCVHVCVQSVQAYKCLCVIFMSQFMHAYVCIVCVVVYQAHTILLHILLAVVVVTGKPHALRLGRRKHR